MTLKPFFRYYGGKYRAAPKYPEPRYDVIIEPFAGSAGYSMRYPDRWVYLVEKYPVLAEMWRYLTTVTEEEIRAIPYVEHVKDLPTDIPLGAKHLIGFRMNDACASPCKQLSAGRKKLREMGRKYEGWSDMVKERVASQLKHVRHWQVIEGDYTQSPDLEATWFIDPPYNNKAGSFYVHSEIDYKALADWCRTRKGQVIVCENEGADWLPFRPFGTFKAGVNGRGSKEVIWEGGL